MVCRISALLGPPIPAQQHPVDACWHDCLLPAASDCVGQLCVARLLGMRMHPYLTWACSASMLFLESSSVTGAAHRLLLAGGGVTAWLATPAAVCMQQFICSQWLHTI